MDYIDIPKVSDFFSASGNLPVWLAAGVAVVLAIFLLVGEVLAWRARKREMSGVSFRRKRRLFHRLFFPPR